MKRAGGAGRWGLALGLGFLWAPILLLAVYAFSADRIPFQWGGFSLRWFEALAANGRMLEAAWLSLRVAAGAATVSVLLGGMAGWALARFGPFRGRALFGALAGAPLVLPEVVTGLSLLLLFVAAQAGLEAAFGWRAERGALVLQLSFGASFAPGPPPVARLGDRLVYASPQRPSEEVGER